MAAVTTHPLRHLYTLAHARTKRVSSWDTSGGNADFVMVAPGETATLADISGPGCITQLYCAMGNPDPYDFRDAVLRMYWDGEETPSVEVPVGDFFGVPFCRIRPFSSLLLTIHPGAAGSHGLTAYFPMPFADGAKITLEHQGPRRLGGALGAFWYRVEYEEWEAAPGDDVGRFHAQWRRENLTQSVKPERTNVQLWGGRNLDGRENYLALEAEGRGQFIGIHLQIDNVAGGWYGEGDDMIFIDGESWPPSVHGTGTEEIFGGGACPDRAYAGPYAGYHMIENKDGVQWGGKNAMYRWRLHDPIRFEKSLRWTIEHGHANNFENDYASVAYWYQTEPHAPFSPLAARDDRRPRVPDGFDDCREELFQASVRIVQHAITAGPDAPSGGLESLGAAFEALYCGDVAGARRRLAVLKGDS